MKHSGKPASAWNERVQLQIAAELRRDRERKAPPTDEPTDKTDYPSSSPEPQCVVRNAPMEQDETSPIYAGRVSISIVSYRKRLCDPDNLCVKALVDCLRYSGLIANDRPEDIALRVSQEKVKTSEEERTEILIEPL